MYSFKFFFIIFFFIPRQISIPLYLFFSVDLQLKKLEEGWSGLDSFRDVIRFTQTKSLVSFLEIWWYVFAWHAVSSILLHGFSALACFGTLRKHKFGRLYSILILIWGPFHVLTSGLISSIFIAWIHSNSVVPISPLVALMWGVGQTLVIIFLGVTRILASL